MAILFQSDLGYFLCHRTLSEEICGRPYKQILFDIRTPFLKDQEAMCEAQAMESGVPKIRKRKRKQEKKQLPLEESTVLAFITELNAAGILKPPPLPADFMSNNKPAREAVANFLSSPSGSKIQGTNLELTYLNPSKQIVEKELCNETFIIPSCSQFYKKDIGYLESLAESGRTFSLIVIDPPWTNRFVKRKRSTSDVSSYRSMDNDILTTLPISRLCGDEALVAVWCTNSKTHLDYLKNILLPSWNLDYVSTWYWIKVTVSGKFVCAWNGPSGKHPFERIILARKPTQTANEKLKTILIPETKLIVSVPCAIHSFKPPLQKVLQPFLQSGGALELFARSLLPNTVSWGNQVPLLQHINLFEEAKTNE